MFSFHTIFLKVNLPLELSFTNEAKNAEKVAIMFKDYDWLKVLSICVFYIAQAIASLHITRNSSYLLLRVDIDI